MKLNDKVVVITGASKGIGRAAALLFAKKGAAVVLGARSGEALDDLVHRIKKSGGRAVAVASDLSTREGVDRLFDMTEETFGGCDVLVNNAGRGIYGYVEDGDPEDWRIMLDLNVFGLAAATKRAVRSMKRRGGGHVVNVSSVAGRIGIEGVAVYCATKFAVVGFSEALRREVQGDGIRVTVIEPGSVATEWGEKLPREWTEGKAAMGPLTAEEVADAILYVVKQPDNVSIGELLMRPTRQKR